MKKIAIQTIGTLGDIRPFVALGRALRGKGFGVTVATSPHFERLVVSNDLQFEPLPGDVVDLVDTQLGKSAIDGRHKLLATLRLIGTLRPMFEMLIDAQLAATRDADAIVYHPKAFGAPHIAEALGIPAFIALPLPGLSPTRAFPSPLMPFRDLGVFNRASHLLVTRFGDLGFRKLVKRWRRKVLGLSEQSDWLHIAGRPIPKLYPYSAAVVPVPPDWDSSSIVTGYWFLDDESQWLPPPGLRAFLEGGDRPVYVGFGSMPAADPEKSTRLILEALARTGRRGVLARGWGGFRTEALPDWVHVIDSAPHSWLFPRMDAVVHHGGAGTTAAALRAGCPTVICPFIGDQFFWGHRVERIGAGPKAIPRQKLTATLLAEAIERATTEPVFRARAADISRAIGQEHGLSKAVEVIAARI
ncbi:MAG: glycosyltransferase [Reyranella sp.]